MEIERKDSVKVEVGPHPLLTQIVNESPGDIPSNMPNHTTPHHTLNPQPPPPASWKSLPRIQGVAVMFSVLFSGFPSLTAGDVS